MRAGEHGSCSSPHGWIAQHVADPHVLAYLDERIPGPLCIQQLTGSLGRALQHTLLDDRPGQRWPHLEGWDLDWATTNPGEYLARHAPKWLQTAAEPALLAQDLDTRRRP